MQNWAPAEMGSLCFKCMLKHRLLRLHHLLSYLLFLLFFLPFLLLFLLLHLLLLLLKYRLLLLLPFYELFIRHTFLLSDLIMLCSIPLSLSLDHLQVLFIIQELRTFIMSTPVSFIF